MFFRLASKSLLDRKGSVLLTLLAISVSIFVLLGIEHIRQQAKESFSNTLSGTDLIVGARTSDINLLLYSVFRIGNATNNVSWESYQQIASHPDVAWTIPISLGDSHNGYRVMGTNSDYFEHYRYGSARSLSFNQGHAFDELFDVVLGAEVARKLDYQIGDSIVLAHGLGDVSFSNHDNNPFQVVGILEATGTPVDQALHVSLEAIEAIHINFPGAINSTANSTATSEDNSNNSDNVELQPDSVTAFLVGLNSRFSTFTVQRQVNEFSSEPLLAILPGITLTQFWQTLSVTENTLRLISLLVLVAALLGLSALLLAFIRERQREISIMRMLGASPWFIFLLIEVEALLITLVASALAVITLFICLLFSTEQIAAQFGLFIDTNFLSPANLHLLALVFLCSFVVCLIPSIAAYRRSL